MPERFVGEARDKIDRFAYLPLGAGPPRWGESIPIVLAFGRCAKDAGSTPHKSCVIV
jgi:hypothetical protein